MKSNRLSGSDSKKATTKRKGEPREKFSLKFNTTIRFDIQRRFGMAKKQSGEMNEATNHPNTKINWFEKGDVPVKKGKYNDVETMISLIDNK